MEKRRLGKSNLEVSVIGFGGIPIQRNSEEEVYKLLVEAHKEGINFIDTARGYTVSEELLGKALEKVGRDKFILATKSMAKDYEGMKKDIEISLKNLRTDHIELYQLHNIRFKKDLDFSMGEEGALRALKEYQEKGAIGHIGITSHSVELLDIAIDTGEFVSIQYPYNPVEKQGEPIFKKAEENDIGAIIMKPLAGGALPKGELCLRYILENRNVTVAIPGMDSIEQIRENVIPGKDGRKLTDEERQELLKEAQSLGTEFCRRCGYCAPCSVGMDIPSQFIMEGYLTRYNLEDWALERYASMEVNASDCIACGDCEPRCPYDLPIIKMLDRVANNFETKGEVVS